MTVERPSSFSLPAREFHIQGETTTLMLASRVNEEALFFESSGRRLFGFSHLPSSPRGGVVFCHPFGEEKKCSHRVFVEAGRAFAAEGFAVVRFDFTGCGDSAGELRDATISRWSEDVNAAIQLLRERSDVERVGLIGLRLGASLAALAAGARQDVAFLVLWEPVINGKSALETELRRKLIKQMMTDGRSSDTRKGLLEKLERGEGEVDLDGYPITGAFYRELCALDLLTQSKLFTGPILLMPISFNGRVTGPMEELRNFYVEHGAKVALAPVVSPPIWNRLELVDSAPLIGPTREWLLGLHGNSDSI